MSASFSIRERKLTCRKCGTTKTFTSSTFSYTLAEVAKKMEMKNTRWGPECLECPEKES